MAKNGYIGITSYDWWDFLKERKLEKINFWNKKDKFNCLQEGDYFFFLKKNSKDEIGERKIVGYATFLEFKQLSFTDAWSEFGEGNGSANIKDFSDDCKAMLGDTSLEKIGCIVLTDLTVFENPVFLSSLSIPFENAIVSGKSIDEEECIKIINNELNFIKVFPHNRIVFGSPGTGKSHLLEKDSKKYFTQPVDEESILINEIKQRPQDKDKEPWFNHIGIKYASYVYKKCSENTEEFLQKLWGVSQNELWKMKTAARATIEYGHIANTEINKTSRFERVTFHPSYSYANFVGTYKPVKDERGNGQITYEFVEGPFIRILRQALNDPQNNYLLIIEEINRANVTAVFGDVFQLLDRDSNNISQYEVAASEDLRKHLLKNGVQEDKAKKLRIPSNMYIWATMNNADQGVQPLDTAFKRRWEFEYLNINNSETIIDDNMKGIQFPDQTMDWNLLRHLINNRLSANYNINEDKLLGPFFIKKGEQTNEHFMSSFKSKVLMYLFEDVCKINPKPLFAGIKCEGKIHYSKIVGEFDANGLGIFGFSDSEKEVAENEILKNKTKAESPNAE